MSPGADPLAQLRPMQLPPEPGLWPPAPGWWLLLAAAVASLLLAAWAWRRWQRKRALQRAPLQALRNLQTRAAALDDRSLLAQASALLRRVALWRGQSQAAGLAGQPWAEHLQAQTGDSEQARLWQLLAQDRYRPELPAVDRSALFRACEAWIKTTTQDGHAQR